MRLSCIALFLILSLHSIAFGYVLKGRVRDASDGQPLANANLSLQCHRTGTISRINGSFEFNGLSCKRDTLTVSFMGYETQKIPILFAGTTSLELTIELHPKVLSLPEVRVTASRHQLERKLVAMDPSARILDTRTLRNMPMAGFADIFRSLQKQQGIAQTNEASPQLSIRGGNQDQNLILLDGAPVYYPFHLLGLASGFNPEAIDGVIVSLGGFSTYFGNRLSSVLSLQSRHPQEEVQATVNVQAIGVDATLSGKWGALGWLASYRTGYFDLVEKLGITEVPYRLDDGLVKLQFDPSTNHHVQLTLFGNRDDLDDDETQTGYLYSMTGDRRTAYESILRDNLSWQNHMISLQWDATFASDWQLHTTLFHSGYDNSFFKEKLLKFPDHLDEAFLADKRDQQAMARQYNRDHRSHIENRFHERGVRVSLEHPLDSGYWIVGAEHSDYRSDYGWDRLYTDLREYRFNLFFDYAPSENFRYQRAFSHQAGFVETSMRLTDSLFIRPGVRLTRWQGLSAMITEPRMNLSYRRPQWQVTLGLGRFSQGVATALEEGLVQFLELYFPVDDTPGVAMADHMILDALWQVSAKTRLQAAVYAKSYRSLLKSAPDRPLFERANGRSWGLELALSTLWRGWHLEGQYTLSRSQRRFAGKTYDANFDRRHRLQLSAQKHHRGIDLSLYWEFHTGQPYSPTIYYGYVPHFPLALDGKGFSTIWYRGYEMDIFKGAVRYPYYHRLDVQVSRTWHYKSASVTPYLSVYNAYARQNVLYYRESYFTYDHRDGQWENPHLERDPFTLPAIPSLGVRVEF
jgi:hypothetical protein